MTDNLKILRKNLSGVNMSLNGAMTIDLRSDIHDRVSDIKTKVEELIEDINEIIDKEKYQYYKFHIINGSEYGYLYFYTDRDIDKFYNTEAFIEFIYTNKIIDNYYIDHLNTIEIISEAEYSAIHQICTTSLLENVVCLPNGVFYKYNPRCIKVIRPSNDFREVKD